MCVLSNIESIFDLNAMSLEYIIFQTLSHPVILSTSFPESSLLENSYNNLCFQLDELLRVTFLQSGKSAFTSSSN